MKSLKLEDYKKNRVDKIDSVTTGINLDRKHKDFLESNGVNLSALVRDLLDGMMEDSKADFPDGCCMHCKESNHCKDCPK